MKRENFEFFRDLVKKYSAMVIGDDKEYLIESRLGELYKQNGFKDLDDFFENLRNKHSDEMLSTIAQLMTVNETYFYRDFHPFETLQQQVFPTLIEKRKEEKTLRVWSAACSTGQEAYSVAMVWKEKFAHLTDWRLQILGTDLSSNVVAFARQGLYSQLEVNRGLPATALVKYFEKTDRGWQIRDSIRSMVEFELQNLIDPWKLWHQYDIVFFRNVMIYFDVPTKTDLLSRIANQMRNDGYLFLGAAETTLNLHPGFRSESLGKSVLYRLV